MRFYDFLGYVIGTGFVLLLMFFFIAPFFIITALLNDKTYNDVKAQVNEDPPTFWESITKMKQDLTIPQKCEAGYPQLIHRLTGVNLITSKIGHFYLYELTSVSSSCYT